MKDNANTILVGVYRYNAAPMSQPCSGGRTRRMTVASRRCAALDRFCVRLDCAAWLGHKPTSAERRALLRALVRLEDGALLVRLAGRGGHRTTHIMLTERGEAEARRILADAVDLLPIESPWKDENEVPAQ